MIIWINIFNIYIKKILTKIITYVVIFVKFSIFNTVFKCFVSL